MTRTLSFALALAASLLAVTAAPSQAPAGKRPLTHADYAAWRAIQGATLSPDGLWVAYGVGPQEGDGELVARSLKTGQELRLPRGNRATVQVPAAARAARPGAAPTSSPPLFTANSSHLVATVYPTLAEREAARKTPGGDVPRNGVVILDLASGKSSRVERVRSFQVPATGGPLLAYLTEPKPAPLAKGRPATPPAAPAAPVARPPAPGELVLRHLGTGAERTLESVTDFSLSKDGQWVVYAVQGKAEDANGVFAVALTQPTAAPLTLASGAGKYSKLTWDEKQARLAFLRTPPAGKPGDRPAARLLCWARPPSVSLAVWPAPGHLSPTAGALAGLTLVALQTAPRGAVDLTPADKAALRGWEVSEQGDLAFSADGGRLFFGAAPPPPAPKADAGGEERSVVELWHRADPLIQPMQKVRYDRERQRTHLAVVSVADRAARLLGDDTLADVQRAPAGDFALGLDDRPYQTLVGREASASSDLYLVGLGDAKRTLLRKKTPWGASWSPGGKYLVAYDGKDWAAIAVPGGKAVNLTAKLGVSFGREDHDTPSEAPPYGVAGWAAGDKQVLIYDRFDIWALAPDGSGARNLTAGQGRKARTQFRVVRLDADEKAFDPARPLLARAENEQTRDTGFYRVPFDGEPRLLLMGARNYSPPTKATKGDALLFTASTFHDYPDLYTADPEFREVRRLSEANPQKKEFVWGRAELIAYKSADGEPLQGVLIRPDDYQPGKKYPMIVYIYERLSDKLHAFVNPQPGTSINPTYYASNGYLVLMPDISYTVGHPGQSALKCVLPAVQAVVDRGLVKEDAIGIQGHSWGGYQTAYLVTQTTRFRAAAAGAPVVNMTSAYGGIRWGTGLSRQFQYEHTQSRIGQTPWQALARYLDNSPLFQADRIKTPLMMLHNDQDEAVPWQQGIEYYLALRRLGKEVYLFNYPGEGHGLRRRPNQQDYTTRMQQFFDHHLKGAAKPDWMAKGLPYTPPPAARTPGRGGPGGAGAGGAGAAGAGAAGAPAGEE